jgi:hypothetical protein
MNDSYRIDISEAVDVINVEVSPILGDTILINIDENALETTINNLQVSEEVVINIVSEIDEILIEALSEIEQINISIIEESNEVIVAITSPIDGREIELRKTSTYIQWRYLNALEWTNLISIAELQEGGSSSIPESITLNRDSEGNITSIDYETKPSLILTRDSENNITSYTNTIYNWVINRLDGVITGVTVETL